MSDPSLKNRRPNVNTTMPSLTTVYPKLKAVLPGLEREGLMHVSAGVLPCSKGLLIGVVKTHTSNGVYVASIKEGEEEVLYTRCMCSVSSVKDDERAMVRMLEGTEEFSHPWVRITKEVYKAVCSKLPASKPGK